jgi:pyridoxine 5-phosphate synthase
MKARLGVNIDHVATLRQARGEEYPSIVEAAHRVLSSGAEQITIHLREDRRHIQDTDVEAVRLVTKKFGKPLNLEMGCNEEITEIACATGPEWICLVPENRQEKTTEGGLDLSNPDVCKSIQRTVGRLRGAHPDIKISFFLEANPDIYKLAKELGANAVEIHTGDYARAHLAGEDIAPYLKKFELADKELRRLELGTHAGHGLTNESVVPLLEQGLFVEYNIGHWIICQALFDGLSKVTEELVQVFDQHPIKI